MSHSIASNVNYNLFSVSFPSTIVNINKLSEIISDYKLHHNYPNPFNPNTKIRFDISKLSSVKLIVYNILGEEITTLVNEKLNAGSYTVNWDGSGYPSGVYFYKLIAGDFTDTKKMLLVR